MAPSEGPLQDVTSLLLLRGYPTSTVGTDMLRNMGLLGCRHATELGVRSQTRENEYMRVRPD